MHAGANGGDEGVGPSPLVPTWLEFGLQPKRVTAKRGLTIGASPLMLPATLPEESQPKQQADHGASESELVNGNMPSDAVLQRSDFMLPLDPKTLDMYKSLLQPA